MKKNKKLFPFFMIGSLIPISIITSCNATTSNNDLNSNQPTQPPSTIPPENPPASSTPNNPSEEDNKDQITEEDFKLNIEWKKGFLDEKVIFFDGNKEFIFKLGEIIFDSNEFELQYVGYNKQHYYSLLDKAINKYYLCLVEASYDKLIKIWTIAKIKNHIYTNLIESYKKEMIIEHNVSDENFFIPIDTSDSSASFELNNTIKFESSWGAWNSAKANAILNLSIKSKKIREMLLGYREEDYDNFFIKSAKATDLYLLPKIIVIDPPINYFNFKVNDIKNLDNDKFYELSQDEKENFKIDVPGIDNNEITNWNGIVLNKVLSGIVIDQYYVNGISSSMKNLINYNKNFYGDIISRVNVSSRNLVESYVTNILQKGKRISINVEKEYTPNESLISLNINSSFEAGANSLGIFADGSEVSLYEFSCIQKMSLNFIEYKRF